MSPSNTGLTDLPPARRASIWYTYGGSTVYPTFPFHGGRTAIGGPMYRYDPDLDSKKKFPPYFEGRQFLMDWSQLWMRTIKFGSNYEVQDLKNFAADLRRPIDAQFGPDGALYVLEFGMENPYGSQGAVVRWEYTGAYDNACYKAPPVSVMPAPSGAKRAAVSYRQVTGKGKAWSWKGHDFTTLGAKLPESP